MSTRLDDITCVSGAGYKSPDLTWKVVQRMGIVVESTDHVSEVVH